MRKNLKFLIPLGTVAATATTLVPCLTSCGNNGWGKTIDLDEYEPTIAPYEGGAIDQEKLAADTLFGRSDSLDIVKQDILCSLKVGAQSEDDESIILAQYIEYFGLPSADSFDYRQPKHQCSMSGLKIDYKEDEYEGGTVAKLSGKLRIKFSYKIYSGNDAIATCSIESKYILDKLPFKVNKSSSKWGVTAPDNIASSVVDDYHDWTENLSLNCDLNYFDSDIPDLKCSVNWDYCFRNLPAAAADREFVEFGILYWTESYFLQNA